jgi:predicted NBD/HSP70 family sugar kinase
MVLDVGGSHVRAGFSGHALRIRIVSGPKMTPGRMVRQLRARLRGREYDAVAIGYPGVVTKGRILREPHNLGPGWVGFDFARAFRRPVHVVNDAAMQALGSYRKGRMLFLGLGTGLGSAMVIEGKLQPMELAHLPYKKDRTFEEYVGEAGLERNGRKKWAKEVRKVVRILAAALEPDEIVLGGGNARLIRKLPARTRAGNNEHAMIGGFRLWQDPREWVDLMERRARPNRARARSRTARR